jgi:hypothetical protein
MEFHRILSSCYLNDAKREKVSMYNLNKKNPGTDTHRDEHQVPGFLHISLQVIYLPFVPRVVRNRLYFLAGM